MGGRGGGRGLIYIRAWVGGQGAGIIRYFLIFVIVILSFVVSCPQFLYLGD